MSPRFYWVGKSYARAGESRADATIRWCSEMADAAIASGGGDARRFVPWILMNGFERPAEFPTVTADMTEDMLRMLRDKGVQEVILWSDDTTQRSHRPWNELVEIADRLWPNRRR